MSRVTSRGLQRGVEDEDEDAENSLFDPKQERTRFALFDSPCASQARSYAQ